MIGALLDTQTLLAVLGIGLSVIFFFVGYRQTIGAKKERVRTANGDIIETLFKRLLLEGLLPTRDELGHFLSGKARDYLLKVTDVISVDQLLDTLYARVLDNDFVEPEKRRAHLDRVAKAATREPSVEPVAVGVEYPERMERRWRAALALAMASASLAAVLVAMVGLVKPGRPAVDLRDTVQLVVVTFALAAGLLGALTLLRRLKETEEETTPPILVDPSRFEASVRTMLRARDLHPELPTHGPYDFEFKTAKGLYLVELKLSLRRAPRSVLRRLQQVLGESIERAQARAALIVTAEPVPPHVLRLQMDKIRVLDLAGLQRFLEDA